MTTHFNKTVIREINAEVENALKGIEEKFGLNISVGNARFNVAECNTKITMQIPGATNPNTEFMGLPPNVV